jgi:peptidoglycan/xylan/chitin deacetylase (PgdA/CDA1 family)
MNDTTRSGTDQIGSTNPGCYLLLYHGIDSEANPADTTGSMLNLIVTKEQLKRQLDWINENTFRQVDLKSIVEKSIPNDCKSIHLTFDDGHVSNFTNALPVLLDAGYKATFYVIAGNVDVDPNYLTTQQLREMSSEGMTIGSHSLTHPFLSLLNGESLRRELADSKRRLEDCIGESVDHFALPGGHYNRAVLDMAKEVGYKTVGSCEIGTIQCEKENFLLPRLEIRRGLNMPGFASTFDPITLRKLARLESSKARLRRLFGLRNYTRLRSFVQSFVTVNR